MAYSKRHESEGLVISVEERNDSVSVLWKGKSTTQEPRLFIQPILSQILRLAEEKLTRIEMDFQELEFMNSSTVTPIIRMLEETALGNLPISISYRKDLKWQDLNFSALEIFTAKNKNFSLLPLS